MKPAPVELPPIYRGCDWLAVLLVWEDHDGNPINLDPFNPYAQLVNGVSLNALKKDQILFPGATIISMTKEQTVALRLGRYNWDWIWWEIDGTRWPPFLAGEIEVLEPKTHKFNGQNP
jgi:hypothetical protein